MDVTKLPLIDPAVSRADAGLAPLPAARPETSVANAAAEPGLPAALAALADQVHIHALDLNGALQILMAEVRLELPLPGNAPLPGDASLPELPPPVPSSQTLVQLFLQALPPPETLEPHVWLASALQVEGALQVALDRALQAVTVWHDVPAAVVDGARQTREMVLTAITGEPPNPLWLRPEWLGLAPRMERYWRRRKRARGWLSDPDLHWRDQDEEPERFDRSERSRRTR